jgi:hypothetical protein
MIDDSMRAAIALVVACVAGAIYGATVFMIHLLQILSQSQWGQPHTNQLFP